MALVIDMTDKPMARLLAQRLQVAENMVRNRMEHGGALTAQEIVDGVRLSHDEFMFLVRIAMPELNRILRA